MSDGNGATAIADLGKLAQKISDAVGEVGSVEKRGHNDFHGYAYVTAEDMIREIREPLTKRNIALFPSLAEINEREYTTQGGKASVLTTVTVDFTFIDGETGATMRCRWAGEGDDPADKGLGKAYTNAIKTFLRAQFLIPQGDDPEADSGTDERAGARQAGGSSRQGRGTQRASASKLASDKQLSFIASLAGKNRPLADAWAAHIGVPLQGPMSTAQASNLIEGIKSRTQPPSGVSDVPSDPSDFETPPPADGDDIQF